MHISGSELQPATHCNSDPFRHRKNTLKHVQLSATHCNSRGLKINEKTTLSCSRWRVRPGQQSWWDGKRIFVERWMLSCCNWFVHFPKLVMYFAVIACYFCMLACLLASLLACLQLVTPTATATATATASATAVSYSRVFLEHCCCCCCLMLPAAQCVCGCYCCS